MPNQTPSSSLRLGVQNPPISPRVWKPAAGYRPSAVPSTQARSPVTTVRRSASRLVSDSSGDRTSAGSDATPGAACAGPPTTSPPATSRTAVMPAADLLHDDDERGIPALFLECVRGRT